VFRRVVLSEAERGRERVISMLIPEKWHCRVSDGTWWLMKVAKENTKKPDPGSARLQAGQLGSKARTTNKKMEAEVALGADRQGNVFVHEVGGVRSIICMTGSCEEQSLVLGGDRPPYWNDSG
jgi:hypothetical protein